MKLNDYPLVSPAAALAQLWHSAGLDPAALRYAQLTGQEPVLPSSFAVGTAAQAGIAASALAAASLWQWTCAMPPQSSAASATCAWLGAPAYQLPAPSRRRAGAAGL